MLIKIFGVIGNTLIGKIPEGKQDRFKMEFKQFMSALVSALAEGAVRGAMEGKKHD